MAAVFFDRDGILVEAPVCNGVPTSARSLDDLVIVPAARHACADLSDRGVLIFMITNQPDISRGLLDRGLVLAQNAMVATLCGLDDMRMCPHDDDDDCACRKPRPGMILDLARHHLVDLSRSIVVGDRSRDIEAGRSAGTQTLFVDHGYDENPPTHATRAITTLDHLGTTLVDMLGMKPTAPRK